MDVHPETVRVDHNEVAHRFEAHLSGQAAFVEYYRSGNELVLVHTEVPPALEGQGLAGKLAQGALEYARDQHLSVVPKCPFVASYIRKHPEYQELVPAEQRWRVSSAE